MHPICKITVDGKDVSSHFNNRIISCEVTDKVGTSSDTVSIELADHPPVKIPRTGAVMRVWMGYEERGLSYLGAFTVDEVTVAFFPHTMSICGSGTDLRQGLKEQKERHWDDKSLKDIVSEIASESGLKVKVDDVIGSFVYPWIGQLGESNLEFLERLAATHNALFSIKDGAVLFAERGRGKKPNGEALPTFTVRPDILLVGSGSVKFGDRTAVEKVVAKYYDRNEATMKTVEESADD